MLALSSSRGSWDEEGWTVWGSASHTATLPATAVHFSFIFTTDVRDVF